MLYGDLLNPWILYPFIIWSVFWKGLALWKAAEERHKLWFALILVIQTAGLLEIIYILYISKHIDNRIGNRYALRGKDFSQVSYNEFIKNELKVGKIMKAEKVGATEKLIRLEIDLGKPVKIIAGIGKKYSPDELIGQNVVVIANLEPREIMGEVSNGMLLAATDNNGLPVLIIPQETVASGSIIS